MQIPCRKIILLISLFTLFFKICFSQNWDYSYQKYTKEDGLPSNTIYCTVTDHEGILWIGTDAGLVRFDGSEFKTFTTNDGLPSNDIFNITCDSKNRLWIISMSKDLCYFKQNKFFTKQNDSLISSFKLTKNAHKIIEDTVNNTIYLQITGFPSTIIKVTNKIVEKFVLPKYVLHPTYANYENLEIEKFFLYNNKLLLATNLNNFWFDDNHFDTINFNKNNKTVDDIVFFKNSIYYLDNNILTKSSIDDILNNKYNTNVLTLIYTDNNENIWVRHSKGISYHSKNDITLTKLYFTNNVISNFFQDKNNNIWISTLGNGLYKLNTITKSIFKENINSENSFHTLLKINDNIFIGNNENQIIILNRKIDSYTKLINLKKGIPESSRILKIEQFQNNNLIITSESGIFKYNLLNGEIINLNNYVSKYINGSFKTHFIHNDILYIGLYRNIFKINLKNYSINKSILFKRTYAFCNYNNKLLLGTEDGLYYLQNDSTYKYQLDINFSNRVMDFLTNDSLLVISTINSGVYFINKNKVIRNINVLNGLSSNNCFKTKLYKNNFYIATNNGINIYNYKNNTLKKLFESDGLASNTVNDIIIENDTIYAATEKGMSIISIANIDTINRFKLFNSPTIIDKDTIWKKDTTFTTRTDKLFFLTLNSLSYLTKGDVRYFYRLNNEAFYETKDHQIPLFFKEPGNYIFEAYAKDKNDCFSNYIKINIIVKAYFYQMLWFKFLIGLIVLFFIYIIFKALLHRQQKKENSKRHLDNKIHNLELSAWRSKINPHFLFNSLNALHFLFIDRDEEKVNTYMKNFSSVLRKTIDNSGKLLNSVEEECNYIEEYMKLEKIKRKDKFLFQITYSNDVLKQYFIPSMLLQPVLENSLKHGIKEKSNGIIKIDFYEKENKLICDISDNGEGFKDYDKIHSEHKSVGIELIDDKIKIIEKVIQKNIIFSFETIYNSDKENIGSKSSFIFPIILNDIILND